MNRDPGALLECGLLQFGQFGKEPLCFHHELLPSFPGLLQKLAALAARHVSGVDRLLAAPGALAWGTAVALETGLPLVYSRGRQETSLYDLVGAYDIGHPTLLLTTDLYAEAELLALMQRAHTVGLEVNAAVVLLGDGRDHLGPLPFTNLFSLPQVVTQLVNEGTLPAGHGAKVQRWLLSRRRGAAAP